MSAAKSMIKLDKLQALLRYKNIRAYILPKDDEFMDHNLKPHKDRLF